MSATVTCPACTITTALVGKERGWVWARVSDATQVKVCSESCRKKMEAPDAVIDLQDEDRARRRPGAN